MTNLEILKAALAELTALRDAAAVLDWDHHTYMPPGGAPARAEQLAAISGVVHEKFTGDPMRKMLELAETEASGLDGDTIDAQLLRMTRFDFDLATKLPADLVAESTRTSSMAQSVWAEARKNNDFATFAPWLQKNLDIARRKIDLYGYDDKPYDALLQSLRADDARATCKSSLIRGISAWLK